MTIWFDLDGTIVDLYGVEGWLEMLIAKDETPYEIAKPLLRLSALARVLNGLKRKGYKVGVISWLAKNSTAEYDKAVAAAKEKWLRNHLASVIFDEINIVAYGTPKSTFAKSELDILFDDEEPNRKAWVGKAYDATEIMEILRGL